MNSLRLMFRSGEPDVISVRSTLSANGGYRLASKTDERIQWGRDDLVIVKNNAEHAVDITLKGERMQDGGTIVRSSRKGARMLGPRDTAEMRVEGGEVLMIRSERAQNPKGPGAVVGT